MHVQVVFLGSFRSSALTSMDSIQFYFTLFLFFLPAAADLLVPTTPLPHCCRQILVRQTDQNRVAQLELGWAKTTKRGLGPAEGENGAVIMRGLTS